MSKEILLVADAVSNEKGVEPEAIFEAIEAALASATRKMHGSEFDIRVAIDRKEGNYDAFRRWLVMDDEDPEFETPTSQILYSYAIRDYPDIQIGEYVEEPIEAAKFGRIAAQAAKQVIVHKVRDAERQKVVDAFKDRVGELIMGAVKRVERRGVFVDLGDNAEAFIPRDHMVPREVVRAGDRIRGYLLSVNSELRGPQLMVSRTVPEFLIELFKLEVPEIGQEVIDILGAARDPGSRSKIAVRSNDPRLDPVGACVGMRGTRVQTVSNELAGERVDIILWDENPAQFVINAMSPAEVISIVVDEESNSMDIAVDDEKLSQAIGRNGQNVRLASQLTNWQLNVMNEAEAEEKVASEIKGSIDLFKQQLDVDEELGAILAQEGFSSIEEIAYVPEDELLSIDEFDEDIVSELRGRAQDALLTRAIATEELEEVGNTPLSTLEGMTTQLSQILTSQGIGSVEALADQAVIDLMEIENIGLDEKEAGALILKAREPWFAKKEASSETEA